jgi:hypothetical protein
MTNDANKETASTVPPVTTPEVSVPTELLEKARADERQKLHGRIQELETQLESSRQTAAQKASIEQQLKEAETKLSVIENAKTAEGTVDVKRLVEEVANTANQKAEARLLELQQRLERSEAERRAEKLAVLRDSLIREANGDIIPSLVTGNTEEELRTAAANSRAQYKDLENRIVSKQPTSKASEMANGDVPAPQPNNLPPAVNPRAATGGGAVPAAPGAASFNRNQSVTEWSKNRGAVLADIQKRYG